MAHLHSRYLPPSFSMAKEKFPEQKFHNQLGEILQRFKKLKPDYILDRLCMQRVCIDMQIIWRKEFHSNIKCEGELSKRNEKETFITRQNSSCRERERKARKLFQEERFLF
ncbi:hypothetical protein CDAR_527341 [Caerostris darwini]|uniref:Uncharacterized protein n=1 Tax=Caerostris darwini TaxID=1538125 RepID=A0AAV4WK73_9ARAC|nr:hypothetical protein CDAR_527341 [Caerostris darwini]